MRIANAAGRAVLIREDGIVDIATASSGSLPDDPQAVYDRWDERARARRQRVSSAEAPLDRHELLAPVPRPRQVFAIGLNYAAHAAEAGLEPPELPADVHEVPDLSHRARGHGRAARASSSTGRSSSWS